MTASEDLPDRVWDREIFYYPDGLPEAGDGYVREQCRLDLCRPAETRGFATVVWFHGGGLTGGGREVRPELFAADVAVAGVGYRLSPRVPAWKALDDAAAAAAWALDHIAAFGGDIHRVFVAGHSAGAYLAAMTALAPVGLERFGHHPRELAGAMPISGQMTTHFQIMAERGRRQPVVVDDEAPLAHAGADAPPLLLVTGDAALDIPARAEENALLAATMRRLGQAGCQCRILDGYTHETVLTPGLELCRRFIREQGHATPGKEKGA